MMSVDLIVFESGVKILCPASGAFLAAFWALEEFVESFCDVAAKGAFEGAGFWFVLGAWVGWLFFFVHVCRFV